MKEAVTKVIDTLTQEDFHGAYGKLLEQRLVRRGLKFHICTINVSANTKNQETYLMILVYIYIYIYIYILNIMFVGW